MKRWLRGALCAAAAIGAPATAQAAQTVTFTFFANGSGVWSGYNSDWTMFTRPVSGATISFSVFVGDGENGGGGGGPNGGTGVGATTNGVAFSANGRGSSSYYGLTASGLACFDNPGAALTFGRIAVNPDCGSVSFYQQYRYSSIRFSGVVDGLTITPGGLSGDAFVTPFVPEPTTWALMLTGFALTGYALRRRRAGIAFAG
jgi:hypothetical protein